MPLGGLLLHVSLSVSVFSGGGGGGGGGVEGRQHFSVTVSSHAISCISIYQISEYQFWHVLIGSHKSEYPWPFTVMRQEPRWRLVSIHFRKDEI